MKSDNYDVLLFAQKLLNSIIISLTVKIIASFAFQGSNIKKISIQPKVKQIGEFAFQYCHKLRYVDTPKNSELEMIKGNSFCLSSIESIFIPKHAKFLYGDTFYMCRYHQIIEIDENSELIRIETESFNKTIIMIPAQLKDKIQFIQ